MARNFKKGVTAISSKLPRNENRETSMDEKAKCSPANLKNKNNICTNQNISHNVENTNEKHQDCKQARHEQRHPQEETILHDKITVVDDESTPNNNVHGPFNMPQSKVVSAEGLKNEEMKELYTNSSNHTKKPLNVDNSHQKVDDKLTCTTVEKLIQNECVIETKNQETGFNKSRGTVVRKRRRKKIEIDAHESEELRSLFFDLDSKSEKEQQIIHRAFLVGNRYFANVVTNNDNNHSSDRSTVNDAVSFNTILTSMLQIEGKDIKANRTAMTKQLKKLPIHPQDDMALSTNYHHPDDENGLKNDYISISDICVSDHEFLRPFLHFESNNTNQKNNDHQLDKFGSYTNCELLKSPSSKENQELLYYLSPQSSSINILLP